MTRLDPPDSHYLSAAFGWLELGSPKDAEAELNQISSHFQSHPDVLEAWWGFYAATNDWPQALSTARSLAESDPDRPSAWLHQAYALRRSKEGSLEAAADLLQSAYDRFPEEPTIPYNLGCYACQLNKLDEAWKWLLIATQNGNKEAIKQMAMADEDLKPLWSHIDRL